jgi:long-chain acyl-CoA synthetase
MRQSLADYLPEFEALGRGIAYAERSGYRMVRHRYAEVAAAAYRFARELNARHIVKGDRVVLWGRNSAAWVSAFLGCANRGVVAVPMDDASSPDFALRVFAAVNARLLVCSRAHAHPGVPTIFFEELEATLALRSASPLEPEKLTGQDPLQIVFTSGTTAEPKGVVITHGNVLANIGPLEQQIRRYRKHARWVHPLRFLNLLPLSHVFGQFLGIYLPPLLQGTVYFQHTLKPAEVMRTIHEERVTVLVAVPRILQSLKEKIERDLEEQGNAENFRQRYQSAEGHHFLRRWWIFRDIHRRFGWKFWALISGGAALDHASEEFWGRLGLAVIQGYGLTETTSLISVNHPFKISKGSVGKVMAGREVKLAPDGEILVRGGGVAAGYWSEGRLRPAENEDGWYHTGDLGGLDAEGNLFFKGRKKDVIVTPAGMNIYPDDLERALKMQSEIKDCVVIPLAVGGNAEPCAVMILRHESLDPAPVVESANQQLAEYQRIHRWMLWPGKDFPRTSTQKPQRSEIAEFARRKLTAGDARTETTPLSALISKITRRSPESLRSNARLDDDLNLSSLDRVELLSALEDRYQVDLSETSFSSVSTVSDLERILSGEPLGRAIYHYPGWVQRWPATWIRFLAHYLLLRPAVFLLGWPRIIGRENLRGVNGPLLVVANHIGHVDVGFILTALPARLRHRLATAAGGEALEALRTPPESFNVALRMFHRVKWFFGVSLLNLFPLPRAAGFRDSFAFAGASVDRGYSILVFPEGRHTVDGKLNPFRSGIGLLANNLGIPVLPMCIHGLYELKQRGKKMAHPFQVTVKIGAPVTFPPDTAPEQIASELRARVEQL